MKVIKNKFYRFCLYLTAILCCDILVISLFTIENREGLILRLDQNIMFVLIILFFSIFLSSLFVWIYHKMFSGERNQTIISIGLFAAMVVLQILFLVFVSHPIPTADAATVQNQALAMLRTQHGQLNLEIPYFQDYPNNHFIAVLFYYFFYILNIFGVTNIWIPTIVLNVFMIDFGIYLSFLSVKKLKNHTKANFFMILCIFCPTTYVWLTFAYTNTFSIPFVMGVLYLFLCIKERALGKRTVFYCILLGICAVAGYLIRPTTILPIIALVLYYGIRYFKIRKDNLIKGSIVLIACMIAFLSCKAIQGRHVPAGYEDKSFPITHWIMMGLKEDGGFNMKDRLYTQGFATKEERKAANIKKIKARLSSMGAVGYLELVQRKLERVWSRGGDDAYYKARHAKEFPILYDYALGSKNIWFVIYMQVFRAITFFFILLSVIRQIRKKEYQDIFLYTLTLLGAILFFIIWEANTKYNICFIYLCLILVTDGIQAVDGKVCMWMSKRSDLKLHLVRGCCGISVLSLLLGVVFTSVSFEQKYVRHIFSDAKHDADSIALIKQTPKVIEQTIQVGQSFQKNKWNRIRLYFLKNPSQKNDQKEYRIEIFSKPDGKLLYTTEIGMEDLEKDGTYCVQYAPNFDSKTKNYSVRLTHLGEQYGFQTYVTRYPALNPYPYGSLSIDGKETDYDLCFQLFRE